MRWIINAVGGPCNIKSPRLAAGIGIGLV